MFNIFQGDSYNLAIEITDGNGDTVGLDGVFDVEITIGRITKSYLLGELEYEDGYWIFHMAQEESFGYIPALAKGQVRVLFEDGTVEGADLGEIRIHESKSREVLI